MNKLTLYSTGCPRCKVLTEKLDAKHQKYEVVSDMATLRSLHILTVPMLQIDDGPLMTFTEANNWVNHLEEADGDN